MSEINSFQWEVSMTFSMRDVWFPKFSHGTLLPLHHNIIILSLHCSCVIIFYDLLRLFLHGRSLSSLDRQDLLFPQSRTTTIVHHRAFDTVEVELDITRHCFWPFVNFILFRRQVTILFPKYKCLWQKLGQREILSPTGFLWPTQLIDSAAWRKLRFKLAKIKLIDFCIIKGTK